MDNIKLELKGVIPMTGESKWEEDNTPLEDDSIFTSYEEYEPVFLNKKIFDMIPAPSHFLRYLSKFHKTGLYMSDPVCSYKGKVYTTKTRRCSTPNEIIEFVKNNNIILYGIWVNVSNINQQCDEKTFEPIEGQYVLNKPTIYIKYAEYND